MLKRSFQFNFPAIKEEKVSAEIPFNKLHEELAEIDEAWEEFWKLEHALSYIEHASDVEAFRFISLAGLDCIKTVKERDKAREHLLEETLDLYHATETFLRMFPADEVFDMRNRVIEKNARRGYYEEEN